MKRGFIVILALILCLSLVGCDSSDYKKATESFNSGNYAEAQSMFEALGDYKDSADMLKECKYNIAKAEMENENYEIALEAFEALGDYKDSADLAKDSSIALQYSNGIGLFTVGDLKEAEELFKNIPKTYQETQKYLAAIKHLEGIVGKWSPEGYLDERNDRNSVAIDVTLEIAGPFSLGKSSFSDCDWCVNGSITLDVQHVYIGSAYTSGPSMANFTIRGTECGSHIKGDPDSNLFDTIMFDNENLNHTIYDSRYGDYSRIILSPNMRSSKECLELVETPYSMDWSTSYSDGGRMNLYKK